MATHLHPILTSPHPILTPLFALCATFKTGGLLGLMVSLFYGSPRRYDLVSEKVECLRCLAVRTSIIPSWTLTAWPMALIGHSAAQSTLRCDAALFILAHTVACLQIIPTELNVFISLFLPYNRLPVHLVLLYDTSTSLHFDLFSLAVNQYDNKQFIFDLPSPRLLGSNLRQILEPCKWLG